MKKMNVVSFFMNYFHFMKIKLLIYTLLRTPILFIQTIRVCHSSCRWFPLSSIYHTHSSGWRRDRLASTPPWPPHPPSSLSWWHPTCGKHPKLLAFTAHTYVSSSLLHQGGTNQILNPNTKLIIHFPTCLGPVRLGS